MIIIRSQLNEFAEVGKMKEKHKNVDYVTDIHTDRNIGLCPEIFFKKLHQTQELSLQNAGSKLCVLLLWQGNVN